MVRNSKSAYLDINPIYLCIYLLHCLCPISVTLHCDVQQLNVIMAVHNSNPE